MFHSHLQAALGVVLHDIADIGRLDTGSNKDGDVAMTHVLHLKNKCVNV